MTEPSEKAVPVPPLPTSGRRPRRRGDWWSDPLLEELLDRTARHDERALERLVAAVHPMIVRYCRARLADAGTGARADEVAQEIDAAVRRALRGRRVVGERVPGLIHGIAVRKVAQACRESRAPGDDQGPHRASPPPGSDPTEWKRTTAQALLEDVAVHEREVLVLRVVVGLSCELTAQTLGLTAGEVLAIQHRALNQMRRTLEARGEPR